MYYLLTDREHLLGHLPRGGVGAEIGVAEGRFSAEILARAQPRELHLIDPWSHLEPGSDPLQASGLLSAIGPEQALAPPPPNAAGDAIHDAVVSRFGGDPRVHLHRQYSYKAAARFEPSYFDFVYLDGNHHYEFVLRDLQDFAARLKPGGLLFGHDFFEDDFARAEHYGVVEAVGTFLKRSSFRLFALTREKFSTFCLAETLDGYAGQFLRNLMESEVDMIELPAAIALSYRDREFRRSDGPARRIPSFGGDDGVASLRLGEDLR